MDMDMDNMTAQEKYEASRYYFGLYDVAPLMWGLDKVFIFFIDLRSV